MNAHEDLSILLLPGMDGTGELLDALVLHLPACRSLQVISFPPEKPLGYDDLIGLVVSSAPKGRFVVVGESFSGPIAIEVAASLNRVAGLVLASSFARHPMPSLLAPLARIVNLAWIPNSIIVAALLGTTATPELRSRLIEVLDRLPREVIRVRASEVLRVDKRNRLREVRCPLLCLHGRHDRLVHRSLVDEIVSIKPACEVQWFDAPHMLLESHPGPAAKAIDQFCRRLS